MRLFRYRGFDPGYKVRPRDHRGWRIPKLGTQARVIYDWMVEGVREKEIAQRLDRTPKYISKVCHRIRNPEIDNARELKMHHQRKIRQWWKNND